MAPPVASAAGEPAEHVRPGGLCARPERLLACIEQRSGILECSAPNGAAARERLTPGNAMVHANSP